MTGKRKAMGVPYAGATTGLRAREEITRLLRGFGCEEIGFADKFDEYEVLLYFKHRGRQVHLRASAKGWARMSLKAKPWSYKHHSTNQEWEQAALRQGAVAVNSILRDWIKGQTNMPYMLTADGRPLIERVSELLPKPDEPKVVSLSGHAGQQS
jgi:hypothetical protein